MTIVPTQQRYPAFTSNETGYCNRPGVSVIAWCLQYDPRRPTHANGDSVRRMSLLFTIRATEAIPTEMVWVCVLIFFCSEANVDIRNHRSDQDALNNNKLLDQVI